MKKAFYGGPCVEAVLIWGKTAGLIAASTPKRLSGEAAEKVPLNYRITFILCLANIIATC